MAKTFADAFGKNASLIRLTNNQNAPFVVADAPTRRELIDGAWQDVPTSDPRYWVYNPNTNSFDAYNNMFGQSSGGGGHLFGPANRALGQSVSAADLGLTNDPAFNIARLASEAGQNGDSWSNYAYNDPTISHDTLNQNLRNDIGAISGYDRDPGAFNSFMDKAALPITLAVATAGTGLFGGGYAPGSEVAGGAAGSSGGVAGGAAGAGGATEGAGYFGGMNGTGGLGLTAPTTSSLPYSAAGMNAGGVSGAVEGLGSMHGGIIAPAAGGASGVGTGSLGAGAGGLGSMTAQSLMSVAASQGFSLPPSVATNAANAAKTGGQSAIAKVLTDAGLPASVAEAITSPSVLGALAGAAISGTSGGAKQAGVTTTTQAPWEPMQPYLLNAAQASQNNYNSSKDLSPLQQGILNQAQGIAANQLNSPGLSAMQNAANGLFGGNSSLFSPVQNISGVSDILPGRAGAASVDAANAFSALGANDPSKAYQSLLTGDVTNPYLKNIANDNFTMANRNLLENVIPGINSGATNSGQFGSSRQGIAQGLAMSRLNQDVTAANNSMFGNAYQQAQGNMLGAAGQLGGFAMNAATTNANNNTNVNMRNAELSQQAAAQNAANKLSTQQFNANLGLQNNSQRLGQMNSAADWLNSSNNMQNTAIKNSLDLANYGNTYKTDALNNYTNTIGKFAGMGGTTSQPYYTNPTNNLLGGAIAGSQIFKNIFS